MEEREFFASATAGIESYLADELRKLGIRRVRPLSAGVSFFCTLTQAMRVCLWSRLASRVYYVLGRIPAHDADALYQAARELPWTEVLAPGATFSVRASGANAALRNTSFTALKIKDAIVDAMRDHSGGRPSVDLRDPDITVSVQIRGEKATVSLDLAGKSLYHRDYLGLQEGLQLSTACSTAASLLAMANWGKAGEDGAFFIDPHCSSGVLACEAALQACDAAPGLLRSRWGFFALRDADMNAWEDLLAEADERFENGVERLMAPMSPNGKADRFPCRIIGFFGSQRRLSDARKLMAKAGVSKVVSLGLDDESGADCQKQVAALAQAGKKMVICSELPSPEDASFAATAACAGFHRVCAGAPGSTVAIAGGNDSLFASFSAESSQSITLGKGRYAQELNVLEGARSALRSIAVPDAQGGPDQTVFVRDSHADQFAARLRKNFRERRKWARRNDVYCYRVYDADLPDFSAAIDIYEDELDGQLNRYIHIAEYAPPASVDAVVAQGRFEDMLAIAPVVLDAPVEHVFHKVRRREKGGGQYRSDERSSYIVHTREAGLEFEVDLNGYLDTGLFLDHRDTRRMIGSMAAGTRFLNLFAYTGTATVHAAAGGAASTVTVDLSSTYLDWAYRNMEINGHTDSRHSFERADVMTWITAARRSGRRFDLIFVDPPTFSNSKAMGSRTWDVQRDHAELLIGVSRLLSEEGQAVFSCNLRSFKPDVEYLRKYGVSLRDITAQTIPHDFERNPRIHSCYIVTRIKDAE